MNLSAEVFQSVVQALRVDQARACADRNHSSLQERRVRVGGRAVVIPCTGNAAGEAVESIARDISPSGIALTLPLQMVRGDRFILHLPSPCGCPVALSGFSILCTVARYQHCGNELYTLGATFTRLLSQAKAS